MLYLATYAAIAEINSVSYAITVITYFFYKCPSGVFTIAM